MGAYLVTGGGGFLGSQIALRLAEQGHEVFCPYLRSLPPASENIYSFYGDIKNTAAWEKNLPKKLSGVAHFAALLPKKRELSDYIACNALGTASILDMCAKHNTPPIIYASSLYLAGTAFDFPIPDDAPLDSRHPYYISKYTGELLCQAYSANTGGRHVCLRISSPYGPGMSSKAVIMKFINQSLLNKKIILFGDIHKTQNFIDHESITNAVISAFSKGFGTYNLCSDTNISIKSVAEIICNVINNNTVIINFQKTHTPHASSWCVDTKKIQLSLGFRQRYPLEIGIKKLYQSLTISKEGHHEK